MKLAHAAALALAGWYLLMPPMGKLGGDVLLYEPLSQWAHEGAYDTAAACEAARASAITDAQKILDLPNQGPYIATVRQQQYNATASEQCIASDDPRLKEK